MPVRPSTPVNASFVNKGSAVRKLLGASAICGLFALTSCTHPAQDATVSHPLSATTGAAVPSGEPPGFGSLQRARLMTFDQYRNTLAYIFGSDVSIDTHFAPVPRADGLIEVGTSTAGVTEAHLEQFQSAATAVAAWVVSPANRTFLFPCTPSNTKAADDKCAKAFLLSVGQLLYRRPFDEAKITKLVATAGSAATRLNDFYAGISFVLEGMLLSPNVLYIMDETKPGAAPNAAVERLDAYSLASRLSFFLWNAAPDAELLRAAASGELDRPDSRARAVDRMLASPRVEVGVRAFFDDMLGFDSINTIAKDPTIYPEFTGLTMQDAHEQTLRVLISHLIINKRDYRDLFTSRDTFISPSLAALYGVPAPADWTEYTFPADSPRVGMLTQTSFLALHSHPGRSSSTLRGKALRELLLCQPVPRPPANVDFSAVENPDPTLRTARDRLTVHRKNPVCAGCHRITDPAGLALEVFDGAGVYRSTEKGASIDGSGNLDGKDFKDVVGLGQVLHDHPALPTCLVKRVYGYALGSPIDGEDGGELAYFNSQFAKSGYKLPNLLRAIALSNTFATVRTETPTPTTETHTQATVH